MFVDVTKFSENPCHILGQLRVYALSQFSTLNCDYRKLRIQGKCLIIKQIFIHNNIPHEKKKQNNDLFFSHSHPEGSDTCHNVLSVDVCMYIYIYIYIYMPSA